MNLRRGIITLALVTGVAADWQARAAESGANPYYPILERNAFALKPTPVAAPVETPEAPPPPPSSIKLTGITSIVSPPKALFEITPTVPGKLPSKPILGVGDPAVEGLEVIAIDIGKGEVRIRNGGDESTVTFAAASSESSGPAAPGPGGPPRPGMPSPITTGAVNPNTGDDGGPTIVGRGGNSGRNSIVVSGGNSAATPAAPTAFGGNAGYNPNVGNNRTVPVRPIRTPTTGNVPPMTREQAIIQLELQRQINAGKNFPPLPPTPLTPQE